MSVLQAVKETPQLSRSVVSIVVDSSLQSLYPIDLCWQHLMHSFTDNDISTPSKRRAISIDM